jgi:hypothetical protein
MATQPCAFCACRPPGLVRQTSHAHTHTRTRTQYQQASPQSTQGHTHKHTLKHTQKQVSLSRGWVSASAHRVQHRVLASAPHAHAHLRSWACAEAVRPTQQYGRLGVLERGSTRRPPTWLYHRMLTSLTAADILDSAFDADRGRESEKDCRLQLAEEQTELAPKRC